MPETYQSVEQQRDRLLAYVDELRAENARLRAALEAAPHPDLADANGVYADWYDTTRAEALK